MNQSLEIVKSGLAYWAESNRSLLASVKFRGRTLREFSQEELAAIVAIAAKDVSDATISNSDLTI